MPLDENDAKIMEILKGRKAIVLLNKSDLTAVIEKEEMEQKTGAPVISISRGKRRVWKSWRNR